MRVLLTGATGFVGAWTLRALLARGHHARALVRSRPRLAALGVSPVEVSLGDVRDRASVEAAMQGVDAVIHCAGVVEAAAAPRLHAVNVDGTLHVADAARARGCRMVHVSTLATTASTFSPALLDEASPLASPRDPSPYVASKRLAELHLSARAAEGLDVVVLNPGVVLGPGDPQRSSTRAVVAYLQGAIRAHPPGGIAFCDARDVASALVAALTRGTRGARHLLGGHNLTYGAFYAALSALTGLPPTVPLTWAAAQGMRMKIIWIRKLIEHHIAAFGHLSVGVVTRGFYASFGWGERDFRSKSLHGKYPLTSRVFGHN